MALFRDYKLKRRKTLASAFLQLSEAARRSASSSSAESTQDDDACLDLSTRKELAVPPLLMGDIPGQGPGKTMLWTAVGGGRLDRSSSDSNSPQNVHEPTSTAAEPEEARDGEEAMVCMICEDRATGLHYGIITCEGQSFFFISHLYL